MSDTYVQLAAELDAYSAGVLPPLKRTKPPTGDEIRRSMRELITHIDQTLVSVAGRLRAMDASLKEQQQQQTGDDQPIPPRTPQEVLDQLQLSVASPTKRRRHSWKSLGNRLRKVIKQVHEKEARSQQQAEKNQRYQEQHEAEGKDLWSWRPAGNKPEPRRRRPRKLPPAASEIPTDLTAGISPAINVVELDTAHLERSPLATSAENLAEDTGKEFVDNAPCLSRRRRTRLLVITFASIVSVGIRFRIRGYPHRHSLMPFGDSFLGKFTYGVLSPGDVAPRCLDPRLGQKRSSSMMHYAALMLSVSRWPRIRFCS